MKLSETRISITVYRAVIFVGLLVASTKERNGRYPLKKKTRIQTRMLPPKE